MYGNSRFQEKYKEVIEFSNTLKKFVVSNNQININEDLINVYNKYDKGLREIFIKLVNCEKTKKYNECIAKFGEEFNSLRSDISIKIEKGTNKS